MIERGAELGDDALEAPAAQHVEHWAATARDVVAEVDGPVAPALPQQRAQAILALQQRLPGNRASAVDQAVEREHDDFAVFAPDGILQAAEIASPRLVDDDDLPVDQRGLEVQRREGPCKPGKAVRPVEPLAGVDPDV